MTAAAPIASSAPRPRRPPSEPAACSGSEMAQRSKKLLMAVDPAKDVDGFHPVNVGRLVQNRATLVACTPSGVIELLERSKIAIAGARAVVIGRSDIVGKPIDRDLVFKLATSHDLLVTVEEGVLGGGFGSAVWETLNEAGGAPIRILRVGVPDKYVTHGAPALLHEEIGYTPTRIDPYSQKVLDITLNTGNLAHKLLGMQLMIETIALTIFQEVRESRIEPVLSDLLLYFEKDEARHVGLGTQYLPSILRKQTKAESASTLFFQLRLVFWTISSLKAMERDLATLGITAPNLIKHGRELQMRAHAELWEGHQSPAVNDFAQRVLEGVEDAIFPGLERVVDFRTRLQIFRDSFRANG